MAKMLDKKDINQAEITGSGDSGKEKTPLLLRWWVIAIAVLFAWPIAVVLIITKLIGIYRESREGKESMPAERKQQIRKTVTFFSITFLFLMLGCVGLTRDYLQLFFGSGWSLSLLTDIIPHAGLALLGIYIASQGSAILSKQNRDSEE